MAVVGERTLEQWTMNERCYVFVNFWRSRWSSETHPCQSNSYIGGQWPLTSRYFQRWICYDVAWINCMVISDLFLMYFDETRISHKFWNFRITRANYGNEVYACDLSHAGVFAHGIACCSITCLPCNATKLQCGLLNYIDFKDLEQVHT